MIKRRLILGSAWVVSGKALGIIAVLLVNALLARLLNPGQMGLYFIAFSFVSVCTLFAQMGLGRTVVRLIAESLGMGLAGRARAAVNAVLRLGALGSFAVACILAFGIGPWLAREFFHSPLLAGLMTWTAFWVAAVTFQNLLAEIFRGFHDIRFATLLSGGQLSHGGPIASIIILISLSLVWVWENQATLHEVLIISVGAACTVVAVGGILLRQRVQTLPDACPLNRGEVLGAAWPVLLANLMGIGLSQADIWILGAFCPPEEVAIYGAAVRLVVLVSLPLTIINAVIPSTIAEMYSKGETKRIERILRASAALVATPAFFVLLAFSFWGDVILRLVYGDYYSTGATVLAILSLGQLVHVWSGSCGLTLIMTGHPKTNMCITTFSSILTVTGVLWAVHFFGTTGVAVAVTLGFALENVFMWLAARLRTKMWSHASFAGLWSLLKKAADSNHTRVGA